MENLKSIILKYNITRNKQQAIDQEDHKTKQRNKSER